jgi:hypothetical protein
LASQQQPEARTSHHHSGHIHFSARFIGETIPGITKEKYFYKIVAYDYRNQKIAESDTSVDAYGPKVLDERHLVFLSWQPIIGAHYYVIYKKHGSQPDIDDKDDLFYRTTTELGLSDVGYPAAMRN